MQEGPLSWQQQRATAFLNRHKGTGRIGRRERELRKKDREERSTPKGTEWWNRRKLRCRTALSRFKSLFVIARNSSFTYKRKAVDIKQVGRELGVRYVLRECQEGGNSHSGQLIDATTGRHPWFDGPLEDLFALQDQVAVSVVGSIAPTLERAEGLALVNTRGSLTEAYELFRKAFEQDREYGAAYAMAAFTLTRQQGMRGVPLTAEMRNEAIRLANLASRFGSDDAFALARSGHILAYVGREFDRGASMVEQAVALNPNLAAAWFCRGFVALRCCEPEHDVESFDRIIRFCRLIREIRSRAHDLRAFHDDPTQVVQRLC
jgi:hypothetical protein